MHDFIHLGTYWDDYKWFFSVVIAVNVLVVAAEVVFIVTVLMFICNEVDVIIGGRTALQIQVNAFKQAARLISGL